jgi:FkbM family methyltransferase
MILQLSVNGFIVKYLIKFLQKVNWINNFNFYVRPYKNSQVIVPIQNGIGFNNLRVSEVWMDLILKKWMPLYCTGRYFIDVGANIGQTLLKVKSIMPNVRYLGFEPNPNCLLYLNRLVSANQFKEVTIYPCALSDKDGMLDLEFYNDTLTDTSASIIQGFRSSVKDAVKVPSFTWKSGVGGVQAVIPGIIKIDVEGAENLVLKTLYEVLSINRPLIICEVLPVYNAESKTRLRAQHELEKMLMLLNYCIARITKDGTLEPVSEIGIHGDIEKVNYVFYHREETLTY